VLHESLGDQSGGGHAQTARDLAALRAEVRAVTHRLARFEARETSGRGNTFLANTHLGILYLVSGDLICESVAASGGWDTHLLPVFDEAAGRTGAGRTAGTAIDAGAHVGIHTLALARRFESVVSFEANPFLFRLLRANAAQNAPGNVTCRNECLYSRPIEMGLAGAGIQEIEVPWLTGESWAGADRNLGAMSFVPDGSELFRGTACTIDSLGVEDLRLLKVDCQGADGEVLMGAMETIRRCRPVILFEWEDVLARNHSVSLDDVRDALEGCGYELAELYRHNDKQADWVARPRSAPDGGSDAG